MTIPRQWPGVKRIGTLSLPTLEKGVSTQLHHPNLAKNTPVGWRALSSRVLTAS